MSFPGNSPTGPVSSWTLEQIIDELNFVICERRADAARIERERKETPKIKALRVGIVRDMESRVTAARDLLRDTAGRQALGNPHE